MIRLAALWAVAVALLILLIIVREEWLAHHGRVPLGRLRRLWFCKDRRCAERFRLDAVVQYRRSEEAPSSAAQVSNLSTAGVGLIVRERLDAGSRLHLSFRLPNQSSLLTVTGQVQWIREVRSRSATGERLFFIGVQFEEPVPQGTNQLAELLRSRRGAAP